MINRSEPSAQIKCELQPGRGSNAFDKANAYCDCFASRVASIKEKTYCFFAP